MGSLVVGGAQEHVHPRGVALKPPSWPGLILDVLGGTAIGGVLGWLGYISWLSHNMLEARWFEANEGGMAVCGAALGLVAALTYWIMTGRWRRLRRGN